MSLLDLPPEIFQQIVDELVSDVGGLEAWKARLACRTFAAEIHHHVLATLPMQVLSTNDYRGIVEPNMPYLLFVRTTMEHDEDDDLPDYIRDLADFLHTESNVYAHQSLLQCLEIVCQTICEIFTPKNLIPALRWGFLMNSPFAISSINEHKLALATRLGDFDLARRFLSGYPADIENKSAVFGNPILHAAAKADEETMLFLLKELHGTFDQAVRYDYTFTPVKHVISVYSISNAVEMAWKNERVNIIKVLIDWALQNFRDTSHYHDWMIEAVKDEYMEVLDILVKSTHKLKPGVLVSTFELACSRGNLEIVTLLVGEGLIDKNNNFPEESMLISPLEIGDRRGRGLETAQSVLHSGTHPNGPHKDDNGYHLRLALKTAISAENEVVIKLLLERGATIGPSPTSCLRKAFLWNKRKIYNIVRSIALSEGTKTLTYNEAKARRKAGQKGYDIEFMSNGM